MKLLFLFSITGLLLLSQSYAFDVRLLANNKESYSREIHHWEIKSAEEWKKAHSFDAKELKRRSLLVLAQAFDELEKIDTTCDLGLAHQIQKNAEEEGLLNTVEEVRDFLVYLRHSNLIDDILYKLLRDSTSVNKEFSLADSRGYPRRPFNLYTRSNADVDLDEIFSSFKTWPDDHNNCTLDNYFFLAQKLRWKNSRDRDSQLKKLIYLAYINDTIDLKTYHKLDILGELNVLEWPVYFKRYADVINNAKDKLTNNPETKTDNDFSMEYVSRREKLTQRTSLYRTYDSTQIMMLAQIMERTAKRIDSKEVTLNWQYTDDPNGETEVYIFSPMEQYRAAIKMLRKDMAEMMRSENFKGIAVKYEHLIAAAYEAGLIKSEELDYVLKFEDFWNPKKPKWQRYANFAFSLAGTAVFYLPPPWNVLGAIGLVLTQSKVVTGDEMPDPDDNWNVIL